jgi:hypothetical protein
VTSTRPEILGWLSYALSPPRRAVYKRLSANDTGATGAHQVGPYIPNRVAFAVDPSLQSGGLNPRRPLRVDLVSHGQTSEPTLIYYNNRRFGGTRNECRLTGFGGASSAVLDPSSTSAILVISFDEGPTTAEAWLATDAAEAEAIESLLGQIDPGVVGFLGPDSSGQLALFEVRPLPDSCDVAPADIPAAWRSRFPSASELSSEAARRIAANLPIEERFLRRHECEYQLFQAVEEFHLIPAIGGGFAFVADFLALAQTTLQRRKSRAGRSLELQLARIFDEEDVAYTAQPTTEHGNRPDFVFPSIDMYRSAPPNDEALSMLAVKSTLRDRWRQVLREADKIPQKHLFTLDQGVSEPQFREIAQAGLSLVVPASRLHAYPSSVRPLLTSLGAFVTERRLTPFKP